MTHQHHATALLLIDLQNALCHHAGEQYRRHSVVELQEPRFRDFFSSVASILPVWQELQCLCRSAGVKVVYTVTGCQDAWDQQILDDLQPQARELVLPRDSSSAFRSSNLDQALRSLGQTQLLVCGCLTDQSVLHTVMDAADLKYKVTLIQDCCTSWGQDRHLTGLKAAANYCQLQTFQQLLHTLRPSQAHTSGPPRAPRSPPQTPTVHTPRRDAGGLLTASQRPLMQYSGPGAVYPEVAKPGDAHMTNRRRNTWDAPSAAARHPLHWGHHAAEGAPMHALQQGGMYGVAGYGVNQVPGDTWGWAPAQPEQHLPEDPTAYPTPGSAARIMSASRRLLQRHPSFLAGGAQSALQGWCAGALRRERATWHGAGPASPSDYLPLYPPTQHDTPTAHVAQPRHHLQQAFGPGAMAQAVPSDMGPPSGCYQTAPWGRPGDRLWLPPIRTGRERSGVTSDDMSTPTLTPSASESEAPELSDSLVPPGNDAGEGMSYSSASGHSSPSPQLTPEPELIGAMVVDDAEYPLQQAVTPQHGLQTRPQARLPHDMAGVHGGAVWQRGPEDGVAQGFGGLYAGARGSLMHRELTPGGRAGAAMGPQVEQPQDVLVGYPHREPGAGAGFSRPRHAGSMSCAGATQVPVPHHLTLQQQQQQHAMAAHYQQQQEAMRYEAPYLPARMYRSTGGGAWAQHMMPAHGTRAQPSHTAGVPADGLVPAGLQPVPEEGDRAWGSAPWDSPVGGCPGTEAHAGTQHMPLHVQHGVPPGRVASSAGQQPQQAEGRTLPHVSDRHQGPAAPVDRGGTHMPLANVMDAADGGRHEEAHRQAQPPVATETDLVPGTQLVVVPAPRDQPPSEQLQPGQRPPSPQPQPIGDAAQLEAPEAPAPPPVLRRSTRRRTAGGSRSTSRPGSGAGAAEAPAAAPAEGGTQPAAAPAGPDADKAAEGAGPATAGARARKARGREQHAARRRSRQRSAGLSQEAEAAVVDPTSRGTSAGGGTPDVVTELEFEDRDAEPDGGVRTRKPRQRARKSSSDGGDPGQVKRSNKKAYFEYAKTKWEQLEEFMLPGGHGSWVLVARPGSLHVRDRGLVLCRLCRSQQEHNIMARGYTAGKCHGLYEHDLTLAHVTLVDKLKAGEIPPPPTYDELREAPRGPLLLEGPGDAMETAVAAVGLAAAAMHQAGDPAAAGTAHATGPGAPKRRRRDRVEVAQERKRRKVEEREAFLASLWPAQPGRDGRMRPEDLAHAAVQAALAVAQLAPEHHGPALELLQGLASPVHSARSRLHAQGWGLNAFASPRQAAGGTGAGQWAWLGSSGDTAAAEGAEGPVDANALLLQLQAFAQGLATAQDPQPEGEHAVAPQEQAAYMPRAAQQAARPARGDKTQRGRARARTAPPAAGTLQPAAAATGRNGGAKRQDRSRQPAGPQEQGRPDAAALGAGTGLGTDDDIDIQAMFDSTASPSSGRAARHAASAAQASGRQVRQQAQAGTGRSGGANVAPMLRSVGRSAALHKDPAVRAKVYAGLGRPDRPSRRTGTQSEAHAGVPATQPPAYTAQPQPDSGGNGVVRGRQMPGSRSGQRDPGMPPSPSVGNAAGGFSPRLPAMHSGPGAGMLRSPPTATHAPASPHATMRLMDLLSPRLLVPGGPPAMHVAPSSTPGYLTIPPSMGCVPGPYSPFSPLFANWSTGSIGPMSPYLGLMSPGRSVLLCGSPPSQWRPPSARHTARHQARDVASARHRSHHSNLQQNNDHAGPAADAAAQQETQPPQPMQAAPPDATPSSQHKRRTGNPSTVYMQPATRQAPVTDLADAQALQEPSYAAARAVQYQETAAALLPGCHKHPTSALAAQAAGGSHPAGLAAQATGRRSGSGNHASPVLPHTRDNMGPAPGSANGVVAVPPIRTGAGQLRINTATSQELSFRNSRLQQQHSTPHAGARRPTQQTLQPSVPAPPGRVDASARIQGAAPHALMGPRAQPWRAETQPSGLLPELSLMLNPAAQGSLQPEDVPGPLLARADGGGLRPLRSNSPFNHSALLLPQDSVFPSLHEHPSIAGGAFATHQLEVTTELAALAAGFKPPDVPHLRAPAAAAARAPHRRSGDGVQER